jgi:hypothetical protein
MNLVEYAVGRDETRKFYNFHIERLTDASWSDYNNWYFIMAGTCKPGVYSYGMTPEKAERILFQDMEGEYAIQGSYPFFKFEVDAETAIKNMLKYLFERDYLK